MTTNEEADIGALAGAVLRLLRDAGEAAAPFLADWPAPSTALRRPPPRALPVLQWLEPACRNGWAGAGDALAALRRAAPLLAWRQTYAAEDFGAAFLERYGWTELIGERGPIASDRIAVGFLLLGPDATYPSHSHDAEEIYLPLSGNAAWRRGAGRNGQENTRSRSLCPQIGGWTARQIHQAVLDTFDLSEKTYRLNQLRYDLRKLKGHGLIERDGSRYAYRLSPKGVQVALLFLFFHKRLCGPLANSRFHHRPALHANAARQLLFRMCWRPEVLLEPKSVG